MIRFDESQIRHAMQVLQHLPSEVPKVASRALNRAANSVRTTAARETSKGYVIRVGEVRNTIKINGATAGKLHAVVKARDTRRPLINFKVRSTPSMLKVEVKRGQQKNFPKAFINKGMSSGKLHVLRRVGRDRYPIQIKYGPSIPEMIGSPSVSKFVEDNAVETLEKRLDHEINRILMR